MSIKKVIKMSIKKVLKRCVQTSWGSGISSRLNWVEHPVHVYATNGPTVKYSMI